MRGVDHRHLLFLRLIESKKALRLALNFILKRVVHTVVDQIEEADVAGGVTQVGQEGRFIRGVRVAGQVENRQGGRVHCVLRKRGNKLWVDSGSGFGHNSSAW